MAITENNSRQRYIVEAVDRALDVLEAFRGDEETSLNAICVRVGLNKSRTFRLLFTLTQRGYIDRTADGLGYTLGLKLFEHAAGFRRDLKRCASPFMDRLCEEFNETVNLVFIHNDALVYLKVLESSRPFRVAAVVGSHASILTTSLGKSIVAHSQPDEFRELMKALSPADLRKLKKKYETIRERGYAQAVEENEPGILCVGAPIFEESGKPVAAMSISGPTSRICLRENEMGTALANICREISRQLGFDGANRTRNSGQSQLRVARNESAAGIGLE